MRSSGACELTWCGAVSADLPEPAAAVAAAVGSPSCWRRTSCDEVATRLPTLAFASFVPAVPPTRLSADVPLVAGALGWGEAVGTVPDSVPLVTGPRLALGASLRPSSAIPSEHGPAIAAAGATAAATQRADSPRTRLDRSSIAFPLILLSLGLQRANRPVFPLGSQHRVVSCATLEHQPLLDFRPLARILRDGCNKELEVTMAWKNPKIVEIALGAEINSYACADLKK